MGSNTALTGHTDRMSRPPLDRMQRGFTLVEVLIAVVIVAVLAAVAYPSFSDSIRKSRRSEAMTALSAIQLAQERWRSNHETYADKDQQILGVTADPPGLGLTYITSNGYYIVEITTQSPTGYTAVAVPASGSSQINDGECAQLAVQMDGGNLSYGSAAAEGTLAYSVTNRCWAR